MVIKIKSYQSKNTLIKLNETWNIINHLKKFDTWRIHLTITTNFVTFKDTDEERVMHSKSDDKDLQ